MLLVKGILCYALGYILLCLVMHWATFCHSQTALKMVEKFPANSICLFQNLKIFGHLQLVLPVWQVFSRYVSNLIQMEKFLDLLA